LLIKIHPVSITLIRFCDGYFFNREETMADDNFASAEAKWLPVIGKALANLCLAKAIDQEPEKYDGLLKRVKFLEGLGLNRADAAQAAGSSAESVGVLTRRAKGRKSSNGKAKEKSRSKRR
jgi:hypothetical protein